jgi:methylenetetrahydrofolate dehydrogenase (NADP+)/methenyltetrahydrofolate cyclohydrolase
MYEPFQNTPHKKHELFNFVILQNMIFDGKKAALLLQTNLQQQIQALPQPPLLAVISVSTHPSIASFIAIKKKFGEALGVVIEEFNFPATATETEVIQKIESLAETKQYSGMIVQLPLPSHYNTSLVLDAIPQDLDVDVLSTSAWEEFVKTNEPLPPVTGAIAYILKECNISLLNKKVVIIGNGKLVGAPTASWFRYQGINPTLIDIDTDDITKQKLYKDADIVISGIGKPHNLKKDFFKEGVVLIDAGTSEQSGVLAGDCDPSCQDIASVYTPVPGGVGPLTVAFLFNNLVRLLKIKNNTTE